MKTLKHYWNKIIKSFYEFMMALCIDGSESARIDHGEESKQNLYWVRSYEKFSKKYDKLNRE